MPLMSVPFKLPAPYPLPMGLTESLGRQPVSQNVEAVMHLLVQEGMADVAVLERLDGQELRVASTHAQSGGVFKAMEGSVTPSGERFAARALEARSALLVMGDLEPGESGFIPAFVEGFLGGRPKADLGFAYVIPLIGESGTAHGVLTIVRGEGPLNHDQPAIVQAFGQWLAHRYDHEENPSD